MAEAEVDGRAATTADEARGADDVQQPAAAKGGATISVTVVLLALLVASVAAFLTSSVPRAGDGDGGGVGNTGVQEGAPGTGRAGEVVGKRAEPVDQQGADGTAAGYVGKRAEPVEHAVGDGVGIPGFNSRLDAFRTWAALTWMKLRRPRSDEPRYDDDAAAGSAGSVADAAKRSFEMGKETVEQAAATTARATRDAAETAKEKVKRAASPSDGAEL